MAFRDVSKALSWAYMMQEKSIIDAPGYCASMRGTSNDLLIGLNAQEAMQQSADIIGIVNNISRLLHGFLSIQSNQSYPFFINSLLLSSLST